MLEQLKEIEARFSVDREGKNNSWRVYWIGNNGFGHERDLTAKALGRRDTVRDTGQRSDSACDVLEAMGY
jgi:hypothetical protein